MARPLRIEFAGALYHVTPRGDRQEAVYEDDEDREVFLRTLAELVERFNWRCHAYCQMTNHYHLVVETPHGNLSKGMRQLNGVYTQASNRRHRRVGICFRGATRRSWWTRTACATAGGASRRTPRAQCCHCRGLCDWHRQLPRDCRSFRSAPGGGGTGAIMRDLTRCTLTIAAREPFGHLFHCRSKNSTACFISGNL